MIDNLININDALDIIHELDREFTSHQFIEKYSNNHPQEYERIKSYYTEEEERKANSLIARYLQMKQKERQLPITQEGKTTGPNRCERWRRHDI